MGALVATPDRLSMPRPAGMSRRGFLRALGITTLTMSLGGVLTQPSQLFMPPYQKLASFTVMFANFPMVPEGLIKWYHFGPAQVRDVHTQGLTVISEAP